MKTINQVLKEKSNDYGLLERSYLKTTGTSLSLDPACHPPNLSVSKPTSVTIVIPAWNVSSSILACLTSIEQSSFNLRHQDRLQVVVVDDGSTDNTWEIIKNSRLSLNLVVIRQAHYSQARALNTGISVANGDVIISCDADMVLCYYTIEHLVARHQQLSNILLIGFFSNTAVNDTHVDSRFIRHEGCPINSCFTKDWRIIFPTSGYPSNMSLASNHLKRLGESRSLWMPDDETGDNRWVLPDFVDGAIFSLRKSTYCDIGGYDERLRGWGCTDSLLGAKAIANDNYVIPVYAASGLHIGHPFRTTNKMLEYTQNRKKFFKIIKTEKVGNHSNWLAHSKDRIVESFTTTPKQKLSRSGTKNLTNTSTVPAKNRIDELLALGEFTKAYDILTKNYSTHTDGDRHLRLGKALAGMHRYEEAIDVLKEPSLQSGLSPEPIIELAIAHAANSEFASARTVLAKLSQASCAKSNLSYWYQPTQKHIIQGCSYFNQGFYDVSKHCFEIALISDHTNKTALKYRTKCLDQLRINK